jgi:acyl-CoA thioesterase
MNPTEQARTVFAADLYATELTGIQIEHVADHEAHCSLTLEAHHRNARGVAMGGVLFTLADFAAAVAANTDCLADGDLHWVSLDANIHFLSPALGNGLKATCSPLKLGRTTALYQTLIESPDNGKRIAIVETTMIRV